jgi:hypothetical protein
VAMDGRYETVYQEHVHREYFDFLFSRPAWRVFLDKYPHEMILLPSGVGVTQRMMGEKAWRVAYRDKESVLFLRNRDDSRSGGQSKEEETLEQGGTLR